MQCIFTAGRLPLTPVANSGLQYCLFTLLGLLKVS